MPAKTEPRKLALATTFDRRALLAPSALLDRAGELLERAQVTDSRAALVLDAQLFGDRLEETVALLEKRRELPVMALEARSGLRDRPALAALDKEESRLAVADTEGTLRRASQVGAPYVVLRLGWVDGARRDWIYARDRWVRAQLSADHARALQAARDRVAPGHVDRARAALDRLCRVADSLGTTLLVKNCQRYVELPAPFEWTQLAQDLAGAPVQPLFDLPAAHLTATMGFASLALTEATFEGPLSYLGDACGPIAALPAGHGELGVAAVKQRSARPNHIAYRPWPALTDDEVALGLDRVR
ncbi:MAG: hypothetical protein ABI321_00840 [Polyangia bacterium]